MKPLFIHSFFGPNRYSDTTLVQALFEFTPAELDYMAEDRPKLDQAISSLVNSLGIGGGRAATAGPEDDDPALWFSGWFNRISLALQQQHGHRVQLQLIRPQPQRRRVVALFEHEDAGVGKEAAELALQLMAQAMPSVCSGHGMPDPNEPLSARLDRFAERASTLVLPKDTESLMVAANRRHVPVIKLERDPFETVRGEFRIRMNSMLMLGHAAHREILDGNFSLLRSGRVVHLVKDTRARQQTLDFFKLPTMPSGRTFTRGSIFHLIVANHRLVGVFDEQRNTPWEGTTNDGLTRRVEHMSRELNVGMMVLSIRTADPATPLSKGNGVAVDLQVAPELDRFLQMDSPLMKRTMDAFLDWLVPAGAGSRVPVLAVTGSNGKTTTAHMMAKILERTGRVTGLVSTNGRFLDGVRQKQGDLAASPEHHRLFEEPRTEVAVLEVHHRGMAEFGFPFTTCDIAACTNVTEEHLGSFGLETVEDMAGLKRSLLDRARDGAVLNADDPHCRAMLPHLRTHRIGLFSSTKSQEELESLLPENGLLCLLDTRNGEEWMLLIDGETTHELLPVADMPCSFGGAARFNIENAMTAAACTYLQGVDLGIIAESLKSFWMGYETTRGRMNRYGNLPFTAIMDFAHSPDGIRRLAEFASRLPVDGKRILMIAAPGNRTDRNIRLIARQAAGCFDLYVCRSYPRLRGRQAGEVAALLKGELLNCGVPAEQITTCDDPKEASRQTLALAGPGDLVLLTVSQPEFDDTHTLLTEMQAAGKHPDTVDVTWPRP